MIAEETPVATPPQSALRTALTGLIGNVLEWFDFAVYGYFASDIGRQFFPQSSPTAQQLLAFAVFALGFWMLQTMFGNLAQAYRFDIRIAYMLPLAVMLGVSAWLFRRRSG